MASVALSCTPITELEDYMGTHLLDNFTSQPTSWKLCTTRRSKSLCTLCRWRTISTSVPRSRSFCWS